MKRTLLQNIIADSATLSRAGFRSAGPKVEAPKRTKEGATLKCAGPVGPLPTLSAERQPA